MTSLVVDRVSAGYSRGVPVLRDVSVTAGSGEVVVVVGANGAGKSTLLKTITGVLNPTHGAVTLDTDQISGRSIERIVGSGISLVPEGRRLFTEQSVSANLRLGLSGLRLERVEERSRIADMFGRFPLLGERSAALAGELSGGQQQMLALAQALVRRPRVLLLDEPSVGLAPQIVDLVFATVENVRDEGVAVVLVEQFVERALEVGDRAYVMQTGQVIAEGPCSDLQNSDIVRTAYLGTSSEN